MEEKEVKMMNMFKYLADRHMGERLAASSAMGGRTGIRGWKSSAKDTD